MCPAGSASEVTGTWGWGPGSPPLPPREVLEGEGAGVRSGQAGGWGCRLGIPLGVGGGYRVAGMGHGGGGTSRAQSVHRASGGEGAKAVGSGPLAGRA